MAEEPELIARVTEVHVDLLKSMPPIFVVRATGEVPTTGWSGAHLSPYVYIDPPADGIQEYSFLATPPSGAAGQAFEDIEAEHRWEDPPEWIRGARVIAAQNREEALIGGPEAA